MRRLLPVLASPLLFLPLCFGLSRVLMPLVAVPAEGDPRAWEALTKSVALSGPPAAFVTGLLTGLMAEECPTLWSALGLLAVAGAAMGWMPSLLRDAGAWLWFALATLSAAAGGSVSDRLLAAAQRRRRVADPARDPREPNPLPHSASPTDPDPS